MPAQLEIREAIADDAPALVRLLEQLGYGQMDSLVKAKIAQQRSHPDALLLVAAVDERPVAFISMHFVPQLALPGDFCRISYFCVEAQYRGSGIGALLEERAEREARARGCDRIELHSHSRREAAHRFYARQGYDESPKYLMKMLRTSS